MLKRANNGCLRLWRDESGVVLALTVVLFFTLFVVVCSVYAVGETLRQRIELQNAADAAAYSAALVQADTISRVAAINRAMAWTYAEMAKIEMDCMVDAWLMIALSKWVPDFVKVLVWNMTGCCCHSLGANYYAGSSANPSHMFLNMLRWVRVDDIVKALLHFRRVKCYAQVGFCRGMIKSMNQAEDTMFIELPDRVDKTVKSVLKDNIADTHNDKVSPARRSHLRYLVLQSEKPLDEVENGGYVAIERSERHFLKLGDVNYATFYAQNIGLNGPGHWFPLVADANGVQRRYQQQATALRAEWQAFGQHWVGCLGTPFPIPLMLPARVVRGSDAEAQFNKGMMKTAYFFETELAKAHKLDMVFFARQGALVVGLARRMNNPLQFLVPHRRADRRGIFNAFTLNDDERFMWTASAARAGYKLPGSPNGAGDGVYETTYWHNVGDTQVQHWNLRWSDWDAILMPLARAWSQGENNQWKGGHTAGMILSELAASTEWKNLYRFGKGDIGNQSGPRGMLNAPANYAAMDGYALH